MGKNSKHNNLHAEKSLKRAKKFFQREIAKANTSEEIENAREKYIRACEVIAQNTFATNW